jgi:hypothetical protein
MKNLPKKKFLFLSIFFLSFLQVQAWEVHTYESGHSFRWESSYGDLYIDSVHGDDAEVDTFRIPSFSGEAPWVSTASGTHGLYILEKNRPIAIGDSVFADLKWLEKIYLYNPIPPTLGSGVFGNDTDTEDIKVYVPEGRAGEYRQESGWDAFTYPDLVLTGITLESTDFDGNQTDSIAIKKNEVFTFSVNLSPPDAIGDVAVNAAVSDILSNVRYSDGKLTGTGTGVGTASIEISSGDVKAIAKVTVTDTDTDTDTDASLSNDTTLQKLKVTHGDEVPLEVTPEFQKDIFVYEVRVPSSVDTIYVDPVTSYEGQNILSGRGHKSIPKSGRDTIEIKVSAASGDTGVYKLRVYRLSGDATLQSIKITGKDGIPHDDTFFNESGDTASVSLGGEVDTIIIKATPNDTTAKVILFRDGKQLNTDTVAFIADANTIEIRVTAEDTAIRATYILEITRNPSSDADLSSLCLEPNDTILKDSGEVYQKNVPYKDSTVTVVATAHPKASIQVWVLNPAYPEFSESTSPDDPDAPKTSKVYSTIKLSVGDNPIRIEVTAEDDTPATYTLNITRAAADTVSTLDTLAVTPGVLTPAFHPDSTDYRVSVNDTVTRIKITSSLSKPELSTYKHTPNGEEQLLNTGENVFTITVASEAGTETEYKITVTREKSQVATLDNITLSAGTLIPAFNKETKDYTAQVPDSVASIRVNAKATHGSATVAGEGEYILTGTNTIPLRVTAADTTKREVYIITVLWSKSTDASLQTVKVTPSGSPTRELHPDELVDVIDVPIEVDSVTIEATATHVLAKVEGAGKYPLALGLNRLPLKVTAHAGNDTTYQVLVDRASTSSDATLSALEVQNAVLSPAFHKDTLIYSATVPHSVLLVKVIPTARHPKATVKGGDYHLNVGPNTIPVKVTAENGTTLRTYTLHITRQSNISWSIDNSVLTVWGTGAIDDYPITFIKDGDGAVTGIDVRAPWYAGKAQVESAMIEAGITHIGVGAFSGFDFLASVSIPATVSTIGNLVFAYNPLLESVTNHATTPQVINPDVFHNIDLANAELLVYEGAKSAYEVAPVWSDFGTITGILSTAFSGPLREFSVNYSQGKLRINTPSSEYISLYTVNGNLIYSGKKLPGEVTVHLNIQKGIIIVKGSTGWSRKVINY